MATIVNDRDIALQATDPRLIATSVAISADGATFIKTKNGGPVAPTTITLTAVTTVFSGPTYLWEYALSTSPGTWVSLGGGNPLVLTGSIIAGLIGSASSIQYRVTATQSGYITASNTFIVSYSKEIDEPIVVNITKTATAIPVDALGVPIAGGYDNTGTVISVTRGGVALNYNASSGANTFYISSTSVYPSTAITLGTLTGSGTTASYADITHMNTSPTTATVTFNVTVRDASGTTVTPNFPVEQAFTKVAGGVGADGENAYDIRFDNESRLANCEYTGAIKSGVLPMTGYTYVTWGGLDITTGYSVTYTVNSHLGMAGATVNSSTGVISMPDLTLDVGYVEIRADIVPTGGGHLYVYRKLFVHKVKDGALGANVRITQDAASYLFTDAFDTVTDTTAYSVINFTATVSGIVPEPTVVWSAKAYDSSGNELSPGGAALFSFSGNTATMTPAQFGARGNPSTRYVLITATYASGFQKMKDVGIVYRLDGTGGYGIDTTNNVYFSYKADTTGTVSSAELAKEACIAKVIRLSDNTYVTSGWTFNVSSTNGVAYVNGSTSAYTAGTDPVITLASITSGATSGVITITATKATFPTTIGKIEWEVDLPVSDGYTAYFDPKSEIILEINQTTGAVQSYADAYTYFKILKGGQDDTANWSFSKVDGPGVTSTLT